MLVNKLRKLWAHSKLFRILLATSLVYTLLRLVMQAALLAIMLSPTLMTDMTEIAGASEGSLLGADLQTYMNAATHFQNRQDLYLKGSLKVLEEHYYYAPSFAMVFTPFLLLPSGAVFVIHTVVHIIAYVLLYIWWGRLFQRLGLERASEALVWTLPVWLLFSSFWTDLGYLNIYIIMALLGTWLIDAVLNRDLAWSVVWLSVILQIKPHWAFAAAVPLLLGQYRFFFKLIAWALVTYIVIVGITILAAGPTYGWQQHIDYVHFLSRLSRTIRASSSRLTCVRISLKRGSPGG